ncbi:MAG: sulfatase-like hydrolase/transferase [bacterium]
MGQNDLFSLTRRDFLSGASLTAAMGALTPALAQSDPDSRPNILWISTEDISPDLGCYGDSWARTPNIDRLASQGALYNQAFSIAGVCAPSRSAIITGMYPSSIGTHHMRSKGVPPPYVKCFPEYLREAGYYCTNNLKTDYNFDCPVTAWDECSRQAHWRNRPKGAPFFSVINYTGTHESRIRATPGQFAEQTKALKPEDRHDPDQAKVPPYYPNTPVTRTDWARYYDLITALDYQVADFLHQLEEDGLSDNTIVFFFGDHGRGLPRAKRWIYDSGIRIPLLIRWPGKIEPGIVCDQLVSFVDFAPTLLLLAGVEIPSYMQGRAFLGEQAASPREYIYAARDRMDETYDIIRCVRDKEYKYIRNFHPGKPYAQYIHYMEQMPTMQEMRLLNSQGKLEGPEKLYFLPEKPVEELYDVTKDPHEINNLAQLSEYKSVLERMRNELKRWLDQINDLGLIPEDDLNERVRPGGVWSVTADPEITPSGGEFARSVTLKLTCPTEGASIAYTIDSSETPHWNLYSKPIQPKESRVLKAKACRLGYKDSSTIEAKFKIKSL